MKTMSDNKANISKNKYFIPTILMIIYICISMAIVLVVKFNTTTEDTKVSITINNGDEAFLNGKYDVAISEYNSLQGKEEWPVWNLRIGEIYSVQGDYKKSNELIQKVYDTRNKIMDTQKVNIEDYKQKDKELANSIVFNSFMNGEFKKSSEYGEMFMQSYPDDVNLLKTMFAVYIANNETAKAEDIINIFMNENSDSDKLVIAGKMKLFIGKYEDGLKLLEEAYKINENNINIFDALEDVSRYNKNTIIDSINKLIEKDKNNQSYKLFLAKIYSLSSSDIVKCQEIMNELEEEFSDNTNYLFIKVKINAEANDKKEIEKALDEIIDINEGTFIEEYAQAMKFYYEGKYEDALKSAKKTIILNGNYVKTYSSLIPSIAFKQNKLLEEEPYIRIALNKEPFNFDFMITAAEYYKEVLQDSSKGMYYYTMASKINPNNSEAYYKMALIQYNNQRVDEAVELLKKSISLNGKEPKYYRTLGSIYLEKNKNEEGMAEIRKAYELNKSDVATLNNAAYYYIYVDHNVNRAMTNIKGAFEGIDETISNTEKQIITDNYNRIKALYDSSRNNNSSNNAGVVSEVKLIY